MKYYLIAFNVNEQLVAYITEDNRKKLLEMMKVKSKVCQIVSRSELKICDQSSIRDVPRLRRGKTVGNYMWPPVCIKYPFGGSEVIVSHFIIMGMCDGYIYEKSTNETLPAWSSDPMLRAIQLANHKKGLK